MEEGEIVGVSHNENMESGVWVENSDVKRSDDIWLVCILVGISIATQSVHTTGEKYCLVQNTAVQLCSELEYIILDMI